MPDQHVTAGGTTSAADVRPALLGRTAESARLSELISAVRTGESRVLVVRGDPGIGKSALLRQAERSANGIRVLHAIGVEAEGELAFAAVHQLCQPLLRWLPRLPPPQRAALETVLGLRDGSEPDHFLVGLAVLSLLSRASEERPVLCVVEDAHWVDQASAQVLGFVARRLLAESIALVFCTRRPTRELLALPELEVRGLDDPDARSLLASVAPAGLDADIRDRILAEARGNPRALLELPYGLDVTQLVSGLGLVSPSTAAGADEQRFVDQISRLPEPTRRLLLVAAAEPSGNPDLVYGALHRLGTGLREALVDELDGLLTLGERVTFRHPLARSAAYRAATAEDRRLVHRSLAEVSDPDDDRDRRAWHLAAAARGPEEVTATELEGSADRARRRGRIAAAAALLQRAVTLTGNATRRVDRAISGADASLRAGDFPTGHALLDTAARGARDDRQWGRIQLLRGQLALASGRDDALSLLIEAARRLEAVDLGLAWEAYLYAWTSAAAAAGDADLAEVSRSVLALPAPSAQAPPMELLVSGYALLATGERAAAVALLDRVVPALASRTTAEIVRWGAFTRGLGPALWDDELMRNVAAQQVVVCRNAGALVDLMGHLDDLAVATAWTGDLNGADALAAEDVRVAGTTGAPAPATAALWAAALRGREEDTLALVNRALGQGQSQAPGRGLAAAHWSEAALFNGLAKYDQALRAARVAAQLPDPWVSVWVLPELVEAAVRTGADQLARAALDRLVEATGPCPTDWARGVVARCRALVSDVAEADACYREAVDRLRRCSWRPELARAHLLYGEWLRRRGRRLDARVQLRAAHEVFLDIGMQGFAERARRELQSTGEIVRRRTADHLTSPELTPQEKQIALLVADGYSNPEVGAQLFLSPRTVEWHLRKIFTKLSISSRRQLRDVLPRSCEALGH